MHLDLHLSGLAVLLEAWRHTSFQTRTFIIDLLIPDTVSVAATAGHNEAKSLPELVINKILSIFECFIQNDKRI